VDTICARVRELKGKEPWIDLDELITYTEIGSKESRPPVAYPEAASFVKFLIDSYGKDKFLRAYKTLKNTNDKIVQQQNIETLEQIYGKSLMKTSLTSLIFRSLTICRSPSYKRENSCGFRAG